MHTDKHGSARLGILKAVTVFCLLVSLSGAALESPAIAEPAVARSVEAQLQEAFNVWCVGQGWNDAELVRFDIQPVEGLPGSFVAIIDWEVRWWGKWCCFEVADGQVRNVFFGDQGEQSMYGIRGYMDRRFSGIIVEGYGMTHQGNGSYYLWQVHGGTARTLIDTRAVNRHWGWDGYVLEGDILRVRYEDANGDRHPDVILEGLEVLLVEHARDPLGRSSYDVRKVFVWNPVREQFEFDRHRFIGTPSWRHE